jgi:cell division septum initiation protein DivIVA
VSYFNRPGAGLQEQDAPEETPRSPFADIAGRFASWMTGADRLALEESAPSDEPESGFGAPPPPPAPAESEEASRFPLAPFGYNRAAVDEHLAGMERELSELRAKHQPMASITHELERIGEQTASILVVAHDQAHETTRVAQEQAERCVADAAANAVAITAEAKERLRELDNETDAVWRERERLLEDVRVVSAALANLADRASDRFPAAEPPAPAAAAFPATDPPAPPEPQAAEPQAAEPQATEPFNAVEESGDDHRPGTRPGDTGSWLAGLEPPDPQS